MKITNIENALETNGDGRFATKFCPACGADLSVVGMLMEVTQHGRSHLEPLDADTYDLEYEEESFKSEEHRCADCGELIYSIDSED